MTDFYDYSSEEEWNLKHFFQDFREKLPQLVIVTGGDYGPTQFDDLSNDQVIRYHQYYEQKRVIGKPPEGTTYLSIPVDGPYMFKVKKRRKSEDVKAQSMATILETNEMPFLVEFDSSLDDYKLEKNIDGTKKVYLIIDTHVEYFLQGTCLQDDEMATNPTVSCLSEMIYVTPITGIKGRSQDEFHSFLEKLNNMAKKVQFLPQDCDLSLKPYEVRGVIDDDEMYQEIDLPNEPPPPLPKRDRSVCQAEGEDDDDDDSYEQLDAPLMPPSPSCSKNVRPVKKQPSIDPRKNLHKQTPENLPSPTKRDYANDILCQVKPTQHLPPKDTANPSPVPEQKSAQLDIRSLKIEDVTKILSQLHLDKYKDTFAENMIDGEYLADIDMTMLVEELGLNRLEALRLRKYVEKGHIPK